VTLAEIKNKLFPNNALIKNSAILFVGIVLASALNYVFHLVIGRQVSVEIYGEAEALISFIIIISVPATTLTMVATKYAATCKVNDDRAGSLAIFNYLNKKIFKYGVPVFLLAVLLTPLIGKFLNIENNFALFLIWLSMLLSFFGAVSGGILRGWQKFKAISASGVWGALTKLIFGVVLVKIGFSLNGIVGGFLLGSLAIYAFTIFVLRFIFVKKETAAETHCETAVDFKSLKKYILPVFLGNLAITILGNADMVLAKHNLDALSAGQYGALTVVSKVIFFVTGIIASVLFSMSAENSHKGDSSRQILKLALLLVFGASFIATLIYFTYPELILGILFGSKYLTAAPYLGWFAIAVALFSLSNVIFQYLLSIHKTKISYAFLAIAAAMLIVMGLYGTSICAILTILITSQIAAMVVGIFYLSEGKINRKTA
jgi:O-antigen/teichoic acid export membrane protein